MTSNKIDYPVFQMMNGFRAELIRKHEFYVSQAKQRLLSQFDDISAEADQAAEKWLERSGEYFDPERHDPADFQETAYHEGIEFYQLLTEMQNRTRLSVIAGFFHEWEKSLREWLVRDVNHIHRGDHTKKAIWKSKFWELFDLFESIGWPVRSSEFFPNLNICRLVVNVYKHGDGSSFKELAELKPGYFMLPGMDNIQSELTDFMNKPHHADLNITDDDLEHFSNAIIEFWKAVPERVLISQLNNPPKWFTKAKENDRKQREGST